MQERLPAVSAAYPTPASLFSDLPFVFASIAVDEAEAPLYPEELALLRGAGPLRRADFAAGRHCAHRVLARLGCWPAPLLMDANGAPLWPARIRGSISHSGGMAAAVAAPDRVVEGIGLDLQQRDRAFPPAVLMAIAHPDELSPLEDVPHAWRDLYAYGLFSAKEAVFKCCCPLFDVPPEAQEIHIRIDIIQGIFTVELQAFPCLTRYFDACHAQGRIGHDRDRIFSAFWILRHTANKHHPVALKNKRTALEILPIITP